MNDMEHYSLVIDDVERRITINGLLELKKRLQNEKRDYSFVDDLIVKFIDAKTVKRKLGRYAERSV